MTQYKILSHNDLTRRGGYRIDIFVDKIKNGESFITTKGEVVLDKLNSIDLTSAMRSSGFKTTFKGKNKNLSVTVDYPKDFYKTAEFGGKGVGAGTAAEDRNLTIFRTQLETLLEKEKISYINLKIGKRVVKVSNIISTPQAGLRRAPKSDFTLVDPYGVHVGWISHKDGSNPTHFQQYGGLSDIEFSSNPEVKKFMTDLVKLYPNGLTSGTSVMRKIKNKDVIFKSVYGLDYGKQPGPQNVDEFHQGIMKLVKSGSTYSIHSTHKGINGDLITGNGYDAVYYARYTSDRGANIAGLFIGKARVGVFPSAKAAKTSIEI